MFRHSPPTPPMGMLVVGRETKLPLKKVSVTAHQNGYLVGLKSTLQYSNDTDSPLEVLFRFPVDESFAVVGLEAVIGGRKIKAVVKEKEEAKQIYDDAMASGFTAALGEEKTGDIFSISLGNLPPKSEAQLDLSLAGELPIDAEGAVRFTLPAVLKPRYTPSGSKDPLAPISGPPEQTQHGSTAAVFDFSMTVADAVTVKNVSSPTHTVAMETKSGLVHVTLKDATPLNKDLVILVEYTDPHEPKAIPEPGDRMLSQQKYMGSPAVMLNFFPKIETKRAACEFIFLIDRSGSMTGSYIKSARETLALFLKSIPPGCSFNIIGFGSSYRLLFPKSVPYDQKHLDEAIHHAETVQADLGGTELLSPLRNIFEQQPLLPGLPRQVFVLTDGSVSNTQACILQVKKNAKIARVFTFGIGSGASTELVKGLARAGNGTAEFIKEGERMQPKVISSLKRALQPAVTDLEVEFDVPSGFQALQAPTKLPTLFDGDKVVIYGIIKSKASSDEPLSTSVQGTATLRGKVVGKTLEYKISFEIPEPADTQPSFDLPIIHQLASKSLIVDWQNKEGWSVTVTEKERKQEIVDLSVESSVVSSHTAYIAVDEDQDKPIEGAVKMWDLTAGMMAQESYSPSYSMAFSTQQMQGFRGPLPPAAPSMNYSMGGGGGYFGAPPPPAAAPASFGGLMRQQMCAAPPPPPGGYNAILNAAPMMLGGGPPPPPAPPTQSFGMFGGPPPPSRSQAFVPTNAASLIVRGSSEDIESDVAPPTRQHANFSSYRKSSPDVPKPSSSSFVLSTGLTLLISLQKAEGFWQLETLATNFLHKPVADLTSKCPAGCSNEVWATLIAMAYLESKFSSQQDEWELVNMKAEFWLQSQQLPSDIASLKEAAKKCF